MWALLNSAPQAVFYEHVNVEDFFHSCELLTLPSRVKLYTGLRFVSVILLPTGIVIFCSCGILLAYSTESALALKRRERYRKFVAFVVALLSLFLSTNLPKMVLELVINTDIRDRLGERKKMLFVGFLLLSWVNNLLTPLVYLLVYNKELRAELWTTSSTLKTVNCGLSQLYSQMFNSPMLMSRRSSGVDFDDDMMRRHLLQADDMDVGGGGGGGGKDQCSSSSQNSVIVDGLASMFKKRDRTVCDNGDVFRALIPNVEYVVNRLNQNID